MRQHGGRNLAQIMSSEEMLDKWAWEAAELDSKTIEDDDIINDPDTVQTIQELNNLLKDMNDRLTLKESSSEDNRP